ncbi:MAG TPA: major capsid protein [Amycolatopsis sp.]|jgi:hypothetical protein|nr:major capsid protein [Amycolatopsis sp.]
MPAAPLTYPLGPPSVSGTSITVDVLLNNPTVITRDIAKLADANFFASKVFSDAGGVEGGAVLYELPPTTATDLYAAGAIQEVAPGEEFPTNSFNRGVPVVAKPRKLGTKWEVTKEAKKRNNTRLIQKSMAQTANTIALTLDAMAVGVMNTAITANSRTVAGQSWATAAGITNLNTSGTNTPISDILGVQTVLEGEERGHQVNSIILNPAQKLSLSQIAARSGTTIDAILANAGITNWTSSKRVTAGTAILYEAGMVGGWANEFPLVGVIYYDDKTESWWYQWSVSPVMFVDDPYAIYRLTGLT